MKRNYSVIFIALLLGFVSPIFAESAIVTNVIGKVEVNRGGQWIPLKVNDKVEQSETINTGFQSEAVIKLNGSYIKIAAMSRVKIDSVSSTENKVSVSVNSGAIRSQVTKPKDGTKAKFSASTPVAVASVRGTDFTLTAKGEVKCSEGKVAVWSRKRYNSMVAKNVKKAMKKQGVDDIKDIDISKIDLNDLEIDIDDWKFPGAVPVIKGQTTSLTSSGDPKKPMNEANETVEKPKTYVISASEKDSIEVGSKKANKPVTSGVIDIVIEFQ